MSQRYIAAQVVPLVASQTVTATGNSGNLKDLTAYWPVAQTYDLILDVTAASGTSETLDVALQISPNNGTTWYVAQRFTQITTSTTTHKITFRPFMGNGENAAETTISGTTGAIHVNCPLPRDIRVLWTVGGTDPSYTFAVWLIAQPMETTY